MTDKENAEHQLARMIYHRWMSNMKFTLDLEEYSYKDKGRNDPRFKFFKKQLMANTYDTLRALFADLKQLGLVEETSWPEDVKDGYQETISGGSGFVNTEKLNKLLR
jgi:hypothetical protein